MDKKQLINELSKKTSLQKKDCNLMVNSLFDIIYKNLLVGEATCIGKMGRFYFRQIKAHYINNHKYNRSYFVPDKIIPVFKASKYFKKSLY